MALLIFRSNVNRHFDAVHTKKMIVNCEICQMAFKCRTNKNRHVLRVHNGVTYKCKKCEKTYYTEVKYLGFFQVAWSVWQYGLWSFQTGSKKFEIFLPKIQHTQRKLLNFKIGLLGRCQKVPKFDFPSQFSTSKSIRIYLIFLFIEEYQGHILLLTFFDNINF